MKQCQNPECDKPLVRKRREGKRTYERRMYCDADCALAGKTYPMRSQRGECLVCGAEILPVKSASGWRMNKTCLAEACVETARSPKARAQVIAEKVPTWRGYQLPSNPKLAAEFKASLKRRGFPPRFGADRVETPALHAERAA